MNEVRVKDIHFALFESLSNGLLFADRLSALLLPTEPKQIARMFSKSFKSEQKFEIHLRTRIRQPKTTNHSANHSFMRSKLTLNSNEQEEEEQACPFMFVLCRPRSPIYPKGDRQLQCKRQKRQKQWFKKSFQFETYITRWFLLRRSMILLFSSPHFIAVFLSPPGLFINMYACLAEPRFKLSCCFQTFTFRTRAFSHQRQLVPSMSAHAFDSIDGQTDEEWKKQQPDLRYDKRGTAKPRERMN